MKVILLPYQRNWETLFTNEAKIISLLLNGINFNIVHIGSTSIEACYAKPIIDIMIGLDSDDDFDSVTALLVENNYVYFKLYNAVIPERRFFVKLDQPQNIQIVEDYKELDSIINKNRIFHVHLTLYKNQFWKRHIAFKEYLINHEVERKAYSEFKLQLAKQEWNNTQEYNSAKNNFIKEIEQKALNWMTENKL